MNTIWWGRPLHVDFPLYWISFFDDLHRLTIATLLVDNDTVFCVLYTKHRSSNKLKKTSEQCCGSGSGLVGSMRFWASQIRTRIHYSEVWIRIRIQLHIRIRILVSLSKIVRKTLIPTVCFVTFFGLFIFERWCKWLNVPSTSNKKKNFFFKLVFVGVLKVEDENSRIRIH